MRARTKSNKKMLIGLSVGFVALMLTASAGLYLADQPDVRVETRNVQSGPEYSLEDIGTDGVSLPISRAEDRLMEDMVTEAELDNLELAANSEVPEPATVTLMVAGGLFLLRRRRKD